MVFPTDGLPVTSCVNATIAPAHSFDFSFDSGLLDEFLDGTDTASSGLGLDILDAGPLDQAVLYHPHTSTHSADTSHPPAEHHIHTAPTTANTLSSLKTKPSLPHTTIGAEAAATLHLPATLDCQPAQQLPDSSHTIHYLQDDVTTTLESSTCESNSSAADMHRFTMSDITTPRLASPPVTHPPTFTFPSNPPSIPITHPIHLPPQPTALPIPQPHPTAHTPHRHLHPTLHPLVQNPLLGQTHNYLTSPRQQIPQAVAQFPPYTSSATHPQLTGLPHSIVDSLMLDAMAARTPCPSVPLHQISQLFPLMLPPFHPYQSPPLMMPANPSASSLPIQPPSQVSYSSQPTTTSTLLDITPNVSAAATHPHIHTHLTPASTQPGPTNSPLQPPTQMLSSQQSDLEHKQRPFPNTSHEVQFLPTAPSTSQNTQWNFSSHHRNPTQPDAAAAAVRQLHQCSHPSQPPTCTRETNLPLLAESSLPVLQGASPMECSCGVLRPPGADVECTAPHCSQQVFTSQLSPAHSQAHTQSVHPPHAPPAGAVTHPSADAQQRSVVSLKEELSWRQQQQSHHHHHQAHHQSEQQQQQQQSHHHHHQPHHQSEQQQQEQQEEQQSQKQQGKQQRSEILTLFQQLTSRLIPQQQQQQQQQQSHHHHHQAHHQSEQQQQQQQQQSHHHHHQPHHQSEQHHHHHLHHHHHHRLPGSSSHPPALCSASRTHSNAPNVAIKQTAAATSDRKALNLQHPHPPAATQHPALDLTHAHPQQPVSVSPISQPEPTLTTCSNNLRQAAQTNSTWSSPCNSHTPTSTPTPATTITSTGPTEATSRSRLASSSHNTHTSHYTHTLKPEPEQAVPSATTSRTHSSNTPSSPPTITPHFLSTSFLADLVPQASIKSIIATQQTIQQILEHPQRGSLVASQLTLPTPSTNPRVIPCKKTGMRYKQRRDSLQAAVQEATRQLQRLSVANRSLELRGRVLGLLFASADQYESYVAEVNMELAQHAVSPSVPPKGAAVYKDMNAAQFMHVYRQVLAEASNFVLMAQKGDLREADVSRLEAGMGRCARNMIVALTVRPEIFAVVTSEMRLLLPEGTSEEEHWMQVANAMEVSEEQEQVLLMAADVFGQCFDHVHQAKAGLSCALTATIQPRAAIASERSVGCQDGATLVKQLAGIFQKQHGLVMLVAVLMTGKVLSPLQVANAVLHAHPLLFSSLSLVTAIRMNMERRKAAAANQLNV